jgi:hypothetical protein
MGSKSGGKPTFLTLEVSAVGQFPGNEALPEAIRLKFGKLEVGKAGLPPLFSFGRVVLNC